MASQNSSRLMCSLGSNGERTQSQSNGQYCMTVSTGHVERRTAFKHHSSANRFQPYNMQQQQQLLAADGLNDLQGVHHQPQQRQQPQHHPAQQQRQQVLLHAPQQQLLAAAPQQQQQQQQDGFGLKDELSALLSGLTMQQGQYLKALVRQHLLIPQTPIPYQQQQQQQKQQQQQQQQELLLTRGRCLLLMQIYSAELKSGRFQVPNLQQLQQQQARLLQHLQLQQQQQQQQQQMTNPATCLSTILESNPETQQLANLWARLSEAADTAAAAQVEVMGSNPTQLTFHDLRWQTEECRLAALVSQVLGHKWIVLGLPLAETVLGLRAEGTVCTRLKMVLANLLKQYMHSVELASRQRRQQQQQQEQEQQRAQALLLQQQHQQIVGIAHHSGTQPAAAAARGCVQQQQGHVPAVDSDPLDVLIAQVLATPNPALHQRLDSIGCLLGTLLDVGLQGMVQQQQQLHRPAAAATVVAAAAAAGGGFGTGGGAYAAAIGANVQGAALQAAEATAYDIAAVRQHPYLAGIQQRRQQYYLATGAAAAVSECGSCTVGGADDSDDTAGCA